MKLTKTGLRRPDRIGTLAALPLLLGIAACGDEDTADEFSVDDPVSVTFVEGLDVFPYEVVTVAIEEGLFAEEGVEAEVIHTENEMQALASSNAEFAIGGTLAVLQAADEGIDVLTIFASMEGLGMNTAFSNALVDDSGLSADAPLEERVKALKGKTIGLTGPLGDDEVFFRYFLSEAGLNPDKDVEFAYIGGTPDRIAAMDSGEIAAYMSSIPAAELAEDRGVGKRMITPIAEEIDALTGIPYSGVHVARKYAEENPEVVAAVGRALSGAANFMRDEPERTIEIVAEVYPEYSEEVVRSGMEAIFPAVPENGAMTQEGWDKLRDAGAAAGVIDADRDVSEGNAWTNEYLAQ
jgi:NitT/TauT family transport system substrate-binding protein